MRNEEKTTPKIDTLWMRLGDNAEYERTSVDEVIAVLQELEVKAVEKCRQYGITDNEKFRGNNYISLFWGDSEAQPTREINLELVSEINSKLQVKFPI